MSGLELAGRFRFRTASEEQARDVRPARLRLARARRRPTRRSRTSPRGACPTPCRCGGWSRSSSSATSSRRSSGPSRPARRRPTPSTSCGWRSSPSSWDAALSLSQSVLQDLGVAALYHDCGYAAGSAASDGVGVSFERHAAAGARLMLRQRGFHEAKMRARPRGPAAPPRRERPPAPRPLRARSCASPKTTTRSPAAAASSRPPWRSRSCSSGPARATTPRSSSS